MNKYNLLRMAALTFAVLLGVFLAQLLPANLFGLRGHQPHAVTTDEARVDGELWTCGMHPHVLEEEPGQCPICGMNLVPLKNTSDTVAIESNTSEPAWVCADFPDIKESEPGTCPIDGTPLIQSAAKSTSEAGGILFYRNPMDPTVTSPVPAKDSMGMDYVPVYATRADAGGVVSIDPAGVQNMNVRTETAQRRDITDSIRTVGYLEFDQQRMVTVTTKYSGWVEKVYVNYVGETVRRGQPLFEIYSPELVQTEQELLSALEFAGAMTNAPADTLQRTQSLVESARQRLSYWDISEKQIQQLEETGELFRTLTVFAPSSGLVMKRMPGLEGMAVKPGMELFQVADVSSLWLAVELFEGQVSGVRPGTRAEIALSYFPGETFSGKVRFLEPEVSEKTRTIRAMVEVPNPGGRLRKGMYATVRLEPVAARNAVAVPVRAVLRTGQRDLVVVALGEGRFARREITVGFEAAGYIEVLDGLEEGETVVTSAQFLLDSESQLNDAVQKMIDSRAMQQDDTTNTPAASPSEATDHSGHS